MIRAAAFALLALLAAAPAAHAQIPAAEYAARRDSLAARMGPGVLLAFGAPDFVGYHFEMRQLPAFDYLTGFREADAVLVMVSGDDGHRGTLFTHTPSVRTQLYDGFREDPGALSARTGLAVRPLEELTAHVDSLARTGRPFFELRDFRSDDYAARDTLTRGGAFVAGLEQRHPRLRVRDAHPWVSALRARKSDAELALLRRAIEITDQAQLEALRAIRPGGWEYEVEAAIEHGFRSRGADGPAYSSIVGSGPNATILHYVANDRRMEAGDLVVMDVGAAFDGYAADVTRTAPVSGRFTPEQRAIYDIVLEAQKAAERLVRPGTPAAASLQASMDVRLAGLARLGLIQSVDATFDPPWPADCRGQSPQCLQGMLFMIHGITHGIGLEVHDPTQFYAGERTYGERDVFTIEPGIYISTRVLDLLPDTPKNRAFVAAVRDAVARFENVGIRIEDDYVVTADGFERLSAGSPREAEEVEAAMARPSAGR
ncbi:MAG TPA: aminopeptidase P N-terminal domain-containing protein [Longimicrobiales bacterium]|nr:aminopeptidase P N-terminal domain-containing protein [Longimicrobiales bacterium]